MTVDLTDTLAEPDYQTVFSIIGELEQCSSRPALKHLLSTQLLNALDASSCFYCFTDPDFKNVQVMDAVNIPESTFDTLQCLLQFVPMSQLTVGRHSPPMAYGVNFPKRQALDTIQTFFQTYPEHEPARQLYWRHFACSIGTLNFPEATMGVGVHRLIPNERPFNLKETKILELIRPALMQTVRSIVLSEELMRYRAFAGCLATLKTPMAMVWPDWRIHYRNDAFAHLCPSLTYTSLPEDLSISLQREIKYCHGRELTETPLDIPLYRCHSRTYRPSLTKIEVETNGEWLWLLRMERVIDLYSKLIRRLKERALSEREIEICLLLLDGFDNRKIAERLCVSYNTVRNHIAHIYIKTDVKSRTQLCAFLNQ